MSTSTVPPPLPESLRARADEEEAPFLALVDRCLAGDCAAWPELWKELVPVIDPITASPRWTSVLCRSGNDRADIVVRVMNKLAADDCAALRRFRNPEGPAGGSFRKWIRTVAVHASVSHVRAHPDYLGRRASNGAVRWAPLDSLGPEIDEIEATGPDLGDLIDAHRLAERLGVDLRDDQRAALAGRLEGQSDDEIADDLGLEDAHEADKLVRATFKRMRVRHAAEVRRCEAGKHAPDQKKRPVGVTDSPDFASSIHRRARQRRSRPPGPRRDRNT